MTIPYIHCSAFEQFMNIVHTHVCHREKNTMHQKLGLFTFVLIYQIDYAFAVVSSKHKYC